MKIKNNRLPAIQSLGANVENKISAPIIADSLPKQQVLPTKYQLIWYLRSTELLENQQVAVILQIEPAIATGSEVAA